MDGSDDRFGVYSEDDMVSSITVSVCIIVTAIVIFVAGFFVGGIRG